MDWGWTDYVPGLAQAHAIGQGDWKGAINPAGWAGNIATGFKDAGHAYQQSFDDQKAAYDQVSQMAGDVQQKRIKRQEDTLQRALAARDPERKAINALYGDPSTWKL